MIKALAPTWTRGVFRIGLALVLGGAWPLLAVAQRGGDAGKGASKDEGSQGKGKAADEPSGKGEAEAGAAAPSAKPEAVGREGEEKKKAAVDTTKAQRSQPTEVWKDPNAEAALDTAKFRPLNPPRTPLTSGERTAIDNLSADRVLMKKYIDIQAAELTSHDNLEALADTEGKTNLVQRFEDAAQALAAPLVKANASRNASFRASYTQVLVPVVRDLLKNHLFARIEGIIALSRSEDDAAVPIFTEVLSDPKQPLAVKERAAVGLILAAGGGRTPLDPGTRAIPAAGALAGFLGGEPDAPWPVRWRAVQALGSLRQSTSNPLQAKADYAAAAMQLLADPKAKPDVRAWAAWALGWMRYNRSTRVNFPLIAYHIGQAAADIGDEMVKVEPDSQIEARHLADLLVNLLESLVGDPAIVETGLVNINHPGASAARNNVEAVRKQVQELSRAAIDLANAAGTQRARRRDDVTAQVKALRAALAKNQPAEWSLVPDGPEFPGPKAQVASGDAKVK